jgi:hypothetical protein
MAVRIAETLDGQFAIGSFWRRISSELTRCPGHYGDRRRKGRLAQVTAVVVQEIEGPHAETVIVSSRSVIERIANASP